MTQDDCPSPTMTESEGVSTIEQYSGNNKSALFGKLIPDLLRKPTIIILSSLQIGCIYYIEFVRFAGEWVGILQCCPTNPWNVIIVKSDNQITETVHKFYLSSHFMSNIWSGWFVSRLLKYITSGYTGGWPTHLIHFRAQSGRTGCSSNRRVSGAQTRLRLCTHRCGYLWGRKFNFLPHLRGLSITISQP